MEAQHFIAAAWRRVVGCLGVGVFIAIAGVGIFAYLVVQAPDAQGVISDGLGRPLEKAPLLLRFYGIALWPGLFWWLADLVLFWSAVAFGFALVSFGFDLD